MLGTLLRKVIGTRNDRELKKIQPIVDQVNSLEPEISKLSDKELREKTDIFKERLARGETLDDILPEAFAVVREAAKRVIHMRHFDVQIIGGVVLHQGKIAEMATGEGKTLVATLAAYLNALEGKGVHIVTVNDYLAKRDREWMGPVYEFLGLTVGVIQHDMDDYERKLAYNADITYGTNNEFGFDYLRDNMKYDVRYMVQRGHHYAIVDEVDSILIDEARTPLIISGPAEESTDIYYAVNRVIPQLKRGSDYEVEEKTRTVYLTEKGVAKTERILGIENLYDPSNMTLNHHINQALRAHVLFKRDVDYVVKDGQVIIVDEFTGRLMPGRRYSDGLHQALEAKEHCKVENENQTLASITFQNYFRMYEKLAGMTGTAITEAAEFNHIYKLDVVVIPTNRPLIRYNYPDVIYRTEKEKFEAVVREIEELHEQGRPVLVGTISIEKSEILSKMLRKKGIPHNVLNAKHHEKEAEIVKEAGQPGKVTIATNMAGRGTDIILGEGVAKKGGLHIIGTERHESRRIDNQLRGRAGRQGDPGSSRFYLSLEDELLRIFGGDKLGALVDKFGGMNGQPIQHKLITKAIENAQRRVEAHNFDIRKHLLEYDDVMNKQRQEFYNQRQKILFSDNVKDLFFEWIEDVLDYYLDRDTSEKEPPEEWNLEGFKQSLAKTFTVNLSFEEDFLNKNPRLAREELREQAKNEILKVYARREEEFGEAVMRRQEKLIMLLVLDAQWRDHLLNMDHLKEGIGLRGYGQRDPLIEYKREGYELFMDMVDRVKEETVKNVFTMRPITDEMEEAIRERRPPKTSGERPASKVKYGEGKKKIGRNDPCPCGSGKKYKKCCGR